MEVNEADKKREVIGCESEVSAVEKAVREVDTWLRVSESWT